MEIVASGMLVLAYLLCLMLSLMVAFACAPAGKLAILLGCSLIGLVVGFLSAMVGDVMYNDFSSNFGLICGAAVGFVSSQLPGIYMCTQGREFRRLIEYAATVKEVGLTVFPRLDAEGNGLLTKEMLEKTLKSTEGWSAAEIAVLKHMVSDIEEVGHKIGEKTNATTTTLIVSGSVMIIAGSSTSSVYGIDREDLGTYPDRRRAKWKVWLR